VAPTTAGDPMQGLEIKRASAVDQVVDALREMILRGELAPGTPLREIQMAETIGISRNTVRDAVRALAREGLVTHTMHRGATVTRLVESDVIDVYRVRERIETQAIAASESATVDQLAELEDALRELERAANAGDWARVVEADCNFHRRLVSFLGSPRLDRFYDTIQGEVRLCLTIVDRASDDPRALIGEHRELFDLIARGERERCSARLTEHLHEAEERLCRLVRDGEVRLDDGGDRPESPAGGSGRTE
jgi:DNA-binding GntR family transcriptional regulator